MSNNRKEICPSCGHKSYWVTPERNLSAFCFVCGHSEKTGKIQPLKRANDIKGIRQLYSELTDYYHSCLGSDHISYLHSRGITDRDITRYKIGYAPHTYTLLYSDPMAIDAGIIMRDKTPFLANRIIFPYLVENVVVDMRGRLLGGDDERKYLSPYGGAYFRGADYAFNHDALKNDTIILTEGEAKAIASNVVMPTVSIPGILSLRPQLKQRTGQSFTICFDSQVNHWFDVVRAIQRLKKHFDNLLIATLPLMGRTKMDIDTFVQDFGAEAYKRVIDRAVPYQTWIKLVRV